MTNSFVSPILRISKTRITFKNKRTVTLPAGSPFADDIAFAQRARRPVLVKTTGSQVLTFAGPAWISGVNRTVRTEKGLMVFLRGRNSALLLPSGHSNFKQLAGLFVDAARVKRVLAVAQTPLARTITDAVPSRTQRLSGERVEHIRHPPRARLRSTTDERLEPAMAFLRRRECTPTRKNGISAGSTCVPFNYPFDGCYARAAYMCAALKRHGIASGKIFCFPAPGKQLSVATSNEACGKVYWDDHVATVVRVGETTLVLDPSLSPALVTIRAWKRLISGASRTVVTGSRVFALHPAPKGTWLARFDSRDARADVELANFRAVLSGLSKLLGPPPYRRPLFSC